MGIHNNHAAFHQKRDDDNKYHFIHIAGKIEGQDNGDPNVVTVIQQITVTEPKTFPGPAVYVTKTAVPTTMNSYEMAKSAHHANTYPWNASETAKGSPLQNGESSNGMSGGAKAGLAFGIIFAIALVAGLAFFCVRRRKNSTEQRGEKLDEKHTSQTSFFSGTAAAVGAPAGDKRASVKSFTSTHSAATAPRLSLRPVTQFLPSIMENRKSSSNNSLNVPAMSEKPRSASPQNPFADRAASPFEEGDSKVATAAAVPAAGSTPRGPNNVHRVQLEFKPSMDDELELKSGQLVRMVHEYDDGWALCMRMDRTQQGVCPRTCLSKLPVKPRPQGQGRPAGSPNGNRGPSPQDQNKMVPRPLTPTRERASTSGGVSVSPGFEESGRNRSMSASRATDRPVSPIDSGVPARKPVAGQAI